MHWRTTQVLTRVAVILGSGTAAQVNWFVDGIAELLGNVAVTELILTAWSVLAQTMVTF